MSEDTKIAMDEMATATQTVAVPGGIPTDGDGSMEKPATILHLEYRTTDLAGGILTERDHAFLANLVGEHLSILRRPDLVIAPHGETYLIRWYLARDTGLGCIYVHLQVADDPDRPLHDHPWDNCSVIVSGGYIETCGRVAGGEIREKWLERVGPGTVKRRLATDPHRLMLGKGVRYSISVFVTGPKLREWGFWTDKGWVSADDFGVVQEGNVSKFAE